MDYLGVCRYFIENNKSTERDSANSMQDLGLLKLMKLVYITHGFHLAVKDGDSFVAKNRFQAWTYGPVLPQLYYNYGNPDCEDNAVDKFNERCKEATISTDELDQKILEGVNESYVGLTPWTLVELTHQPGSPWSRNFVDGRKEKIPDREIQAHYNRILDSRSNVA